MCEVNLISEDIYPIYPDDYLYYQKCIPGIHQIPVDDGGCFFRNPNKSIDEHILPATTTNRPTGHLVEDRYELVFLVALVYI